jgi:hypothetical protein
MRLLAKSPLKGVIFHEIFGLKKESSLVMVITCPRSNQRLNAGKPPLKKFLHAGLRIALGTDSHLHSPGWPEAGQEPRVCFDIGYLT